MPELVLLRQASLDLEEIDTYLRGNSSPSADRFLDNAEWLFSSIAAHPYLGTRAKFVRLTSLDIRWRPVPGFRKYLVFFVPGEERVQVLRILHGARNIEKIFTGRGLLESDEEDPAQ